MMDKMTNRSRGFGFVWFNSRAGMEDAIRDKHNAELDGRRISVKEAIPQDQIPPGERQARAALPLLLYRSSVEAAVRTAAATGAVF